MMTLNRQRTEVNLDSIFEAALGPLDLVDSPEKRSDLERFLAYSRVHQERAIVNVLSEIAATVNEAGGGTRLRLEHEGGRLYIAVDTEGEGSEEAAFPSDGEIERVTLRLPARLKQLADQAAGVRGVSTNTWYIRTLARSLVHQMRGEAARGHRGALTGRRDRRGPRRESRHERD